MSPDGSGGSVTIHADASIRAGLFDGAESADLHLVLGRLAYVHVVRGRIDVNGSTLEAGDAAKISGESRLMVTNGRHAEILVFDLAD